jgi:endonuclease YncB( thermonuclease family)
MALPNHLVITGNFVIVGKEPDGDSVRFVADNPSLFDKLEDGHRAVVSKDGSIQLRFEGVDSTELHYGPFAQPLGVKARDELLGWMGFSNVKTKAGSTLVESADPANGVAGTILCKKVELHGRPVSFVLLAEQARDLTDGEIVLLDRQRLEQTLNWRLLETGWAYYTVYTSTPLRGDLREAAQKARAAREGLGRGVWAQDSTREFRLVDQDSIGPKGSEILPKLFRRCTDYLKAIGGGFQGELTDWLLANAGPPRRENDRVVLPDKTEVHLSDLISQRNATVVFQPDLLDIVFVEK